MSVLPCIGVEIVEGGRRAVAAVLQRRLLSTRKPFRTAALSGLATRRLRSRRMARATDLGDCDPNAIKADAG